MGRIDNKIATNKVSESAIDFKMGAGNTSTSRGQQTVSLPSHLIERVEGRLSGTGFSSSSEYIAFLLEETLARVEPRANDEQSATNEKQIRDRLESLGYLE